MELLCLGYCRLRLLRPRIVINILKIQPDFNSEVRLYFYSLTLSSPSSEITNIDSGKSARLNV